MVGLSILLESHKGTKKTNNPAQVINKATMIKPSSSPSPPPTQPTHLSSGWNSPPSLPLAGFLDRCFLCHQKLLPCKDIYMYKGDRAFCSVECRCRQMFMDEEESNKTNVYKRDICSLAAMRGPKPTACSSSSSSSSSSSASNSHRNRKGNRNRANGFEF